MFKVKEEKPVNDLEAFEFRKTTNAYIKEHNLTEDEFAGLIKRDSYLFKKYLHNLIIPSPEIKQVVQKFITEGGK